MDVSVGTRLRVLRKDAGLTQAQLAALAGTNQAAINRYETDRAAAPYRILVWYATYFNVSLDYIFGLCEDPAGSMSASRRRRHRKWCNANRIGASSWKPASRRAAS